MPVRPLVNRMAAVSSARASAMHSGTWVAAERRTVASGTPRQPTAAPRLARPAEQAARQGRLRDADERLGLCLAQTDAEVLDAHARVDEDDDCADLEQRERQGEEFEARRDHEHRAHAAPDADLVQ